MNENKVVNYKVENAGLWFNADARQINLRLQFSNVVVSIKLDSNQHENLNKLFELSEVFGIYDCNGTFVKEITGKFCRLEIENDMPIKIMHIVDNSIEIEINKDR
jgi:hypothetical protein